MNFSSKMAKIIFGPEGPRPEAPELEAPELEAP
jgi:hypothetical protein